MEDEEEVTTKNKKDISLFTVQHRLKREDCHRTKHDSAFSKWQILVGSSDWDNYRLGKDGAERYRIANLPTITCPGIYELAVAPANDGRDLRKLAPHHILVVYLGQADNVRTRLQHYGRAGSHLDHHHHHHATHISPPSVIIISNNKRPGFFQDVFARGFSILFRWAPMKNKREAEEKEALLLGVFDYAWNKIANGSCRRDDILVKLNSMLPASNPLDTLVRKLKLLKAQAFGRNQVGVRVYASKPSLQVESTDSCDFDQTSNRIFKFVRSRPRLIVEASDTNDDTNICGMIKADGSICVNRPNLGRKRCPEHKGRRISASRGIVTSTESSVIKKVNGEGAELVEKTTACGVILEDGSVCMMLPPKGRKRCEAHKGRRITISKRALTATDISLSKKSMDKDRNLKEEPQHVV